MGENSTRIRRTEVWSENVRTKENFGSLVTDGEVLGFLAAPLSTEFIIQRSVKD